MGWKNEYTAIDTETTGLDHRARIIEMSIVQFVAGEVHDVWGTTFCPPDIDFNDPQVKQALAVNGFTRESLGVRRFWEARYEVLGRLDGGVWVGHNLEFDIRMMRQEWEKFMKPLRLPVPVTKICTLLCDFAVSPGIKSRKLIEVCRRWGVQVGDGQGLHRASSDAIAAGRVLYAMKDKLPDEDGELRELLSAADAEWRQILAKR